jgi:hypothetical protein
MNVLFLDDSLGRQKDFRRHYPSAKIVATVSTCVEALQSEDWDVVFLDHDLGNETYVNSTREDCGMEVARWIIENRPSIGTIVCHSLNEPARKEMVHKLADADYKVFNIPFLNLFKSPIVESLLDVEDPD